MTRSARIVFENAVYHIVSRGTRMDEIFRCNFDRLKFLEKMNESLLKFGGICYCYCLMDNHYHLVLRTPFANISEIMHHLNCSYSNWFRFKYELVGPLFQGRYKGILVDEDNYLLQLTAYIHLNPARAGIVQHPEEYKWSSFRNYTLKTKKMKSLNTEFVLGMLDTNRKKAIEKYIHYVVENQKMINPCEHAYKGLAVGDEDFLAKIDHLLEIIPETTEIPETRNREKYGYNVILKAIEVASGKKKKIIIDKHFGKTERKLAIYLLKKYSMLKLIEIGVIFNMVYSSVSKTVFRFEQELVESKKSRDLLELVLEELKNVKCRLRC